MRAVTFKAAVGFALTCGKVTRWAVTPKSWPPGHGDLGDLHSFVAWRTGNARLSDISSFKKNGRAE